MSAGELRLLDYETRERWLAARSSGIGASESAALFGVSPWLTPVSLWALKVGRIQHEELEGEWIEWGNLLEEPIAKRYEKKTGRKLWQASPFAVAQHPTIPFMRATPDRLVVEAPDREGQGVLQIKNTNAFKGHDWDAGVPDFIEIQVQHEMAVTGLAWASVAVLIGGAEFRHFDVDRNQPFIDELEAQCAWLWDFVVRCEQPPVDGSLRTLEALKKLHPRDTGGEVVLPAEAAQWWHELTEIRALESQIRKSKPKVEAFLVDAFGDASYGVLPGGQRISYLTTERDGYSVEATTFRTFRLETDKAKKKGQLR